MQRDKNGRFKEKYTDDELDWIKENYNKNDLKSLTNEFNSKFSKNLNKLNMQYITYTKLKLRKTQRYSKDEDEFLKENVNKFKTYKDLTIAFNDKFNKNKNKKSIEIRCQTVLKINKNTNIGRIKKGEILHNNNELPLGTEVYDEVRENIYIKTKLHQKSNFPKYKESKSREYPYWTLKQQKIYEDEFGQIGKDEMIIFLDGNRKNYNLDNLFCIKRTEWIRLVRNKWYGTDKNLTRTAIELIRLKRNIKEKL